MNSNIDKQNLLDQFLGGELRGERLDLFLSLLENDSQLRRALDLASGIEAASLGRDSSYPEDAGYADAVDRAIRNTVGIIGPANHSRRVMAYAVAATLALLVLGGMMFRGMQHVEPVKVAGIGQTTIPEDGKTVTSLAKGASLVTESGTKARIFDNGNLGKTVALAQGNAVFAADGKSDRPIQVVTPHLALTLRGTVFRIVVTELETEVTVFEGAVDIVHRRQPDQVKTVLAGGTGVGDISSLSTAGMLTSAMCKRRTALLRSYVDWVSAQIRG